MVNLSVVYYRQNKNGDKMKKAKPIKILTLDTETYGLTGGLKRIAVYDGIEVVYGYTFKDVLTVINKYAKFGFNVYTYIHNLEFDFRKIADEIKETDTILWDKCFIVNNRLIRINTKNYILQDSGALLPMSLDDLSKGFDVIHAKMDLWKEVKKNYPNKFKDKLDYFIRCDKDDPIYLKYLGYDVISLYEIIHKVMDLSGIRINDFVKCMTTASLSRYLFKNGHKGTIFKNEKMRGLIMKFLQVLTGIIIRIWRNF